MAARNARRYLANPDVSCREETAGRNAILFNPDTDALLAINPTGLVLWRALARPFSRDRLVAHMLRTCEGAPTGQVAGDVEAFLCALRPRGFVGQVLDSDRANVYDADGAPDPEPEGEPGAPRGPVAEVTAEGCNRFYRGRSMLGTFRPGDRLTVESVPIVALRPGDVVLYRGQEREGEQDEVVHRVVALAPGGLVTRGDNNRGVDRTLVTEDRLLGRVTRLERGGRVRRVRGGRLGLLRLRVLHALRVVGRTGWRLLRAVGRRPYRRLRESGLAHRVWRPAMVRVLVATDRGPLVKVVSRGRTVARWWPETGRFWCRRPYELLIPRPNRKETIDHEATR